MRRVRGWFRTRTEDGWREWFAGRIVCTVVGHRWYPKMRGALCDRCFVFKSDWQERTRR